jgi:hypothetical protein
VKGGLVEDHSGAVFGDFSYALSVQPENLFPLDRIHRIVNVNDRLTGTPKGFEGPDDQIFPDLAQNLDRDIFGNVPFFDQRPDKLEFGSRRRGKPDFDFLEPHPDEELEKTKLSLAVHRGNKRLVPVPEIDAGPDGCDGDGPVGPATVFLPEGEALRISAVIIQGHVGKLLNLDGRCLFCKVR